MTNTSIETAKQILKSHALFSACSETTLSFAAGGCSLIGFAKGEELKSEDDRPFLCMIRQGSATVYTLEKNSELLLRILKSGDIFGVATLFDQTGQASVTKIIACEDTEALCMSEAVFKQLLAKDAELTLRYINFMADRIRFLHRRIACISAGTAEEKLCAWLCDQLDVDSETCEVVLPMSMTRLAEILGVGRASLYRAFDELTEQGILAKDGHKIHVIRKKALQNYEIHPHL